MYSHDSQTPLVEVNQGVLAWSFRQFWRKLVVQINEDNNTTFRKWSCYKFLLWAKVCACCNSAITMFFVKFHTFTCKNAERVHTVDCRWYWYTPFGKVNQAELMI